MNTTEAKIYSGFSRQLQLWRDEVVRHEQRLGWKVGFALPVDQQRFELPSALVGYLTQARHLSSGQCYRAPATAMLKVEPEVAVLIGRDVSVGASLEQAQAAIASYAPALELVDSTRSVHDDIEAILAGNMFHEAVLLGAPLPARAYDRKHLELSLAINGKETSTLEHQRVPQDFSALILTVAGLLEAQGERLLRGDWIITGAAATPVPVQGGDSIALDMGFMGKLKLTIG
ncbi:MAG: fumarylacetoacetate hydrolase family protein [Gammaproteobacteria bacterium]|nr:fumarylacetoacetate hydrolase family protein [Gammaproteobacteria bacterium]